MFQKNRPWRSRKYLSWIRKQPCFNGCYGPTVAHHITGVGSLSGTGRKAGDNYAIPLCVECHAEMHGDSTLWAHQWEFIARTIGKALEEGILGVK
jgi:hypothetical protein